MGKKTAAAEPKALRVGDPDDLKGEGKDLGGSQSDHWNLLIVNQVLNSLWLKNADQETKDEYFSAAAHALIGIGPKEELEGMLAAQLLASHHAAMECFRRGMLPEQSIEARHENLNQANRLSRTYATLLEALNRHRGKGQQRVTVEHVTVNQGGQAIVGTVEHPGGGSSTELKDQPHALAYAPSTAMPSTIEAERETMPVASGQE